MEKYCILKMGCHEELNQAAKHSTRRRHYLQAVGQEQAQPGTEGAQGKDYCEVAHLWLDEEKIKSIVLSEFVELVGVEAVQKAIGKQLPRHWHTAAAIVHVSLDCVLEVVHVTVFRVGVTSPSESLTFEESAKELSPSVLDSVSLLSASLA